MAVKKQRKNWRDIGVEMLGIIFAVLLALWLEGWREDIERRDRADDFLERIRVEVSENRTELMEAIADNQRNFTGMEKSLDGGELDFAELAPFLIISGGSTSNSAWMSAQMTQSINDMPIETVASLAALYDTQAYYADYVRFFIQKFTDLTSAMQNEEAGIVAAKKFQQHLSITNTLAQQLIVAYDEFLGTEPENTPKQADAETTKVP